MRLTRRAQRAQRWGWVRRMAAVLGCAAGLAGARGQTNEAWLGQSIYQIVTDRFCDGDPSNNNADGNYRPKAARSPHGGDFRGIEQKLDYVKALGGDGDLDFAGGAQRARRISRLRGAEFPGGGPAVGDDGGFAAAGEGGARAGFAVIDDIVVNHGADLIDSSDAGYGKFRAPPEGYTLRYRNATNTYPAPFELNAARPALTNLFHHHGTIQNYGDPAQVVLGELAGLDDFRTENALRAGADGADLRILDRAGGV